MKPRRIELVLGSGLTVKGDYYPGYKGSDVEPPESECFEAEKIYVRDIDVTEIFGEYVDWKRIEADAIEAMRGAE